MFNKRVLRYKIFSPEGKTAKTTQLQVISFRQKNLLCLKSKDSSDVETFKFIIVSKLEL